jgi:hypothetical protein
MMSNMDVIIPLIIVAMSLTVRLTSSWNIFYYDTDMYPLPRWTVTCAAMRGGHSVNDSTLVTCDLAI